MSLWQNLYANQMHSVLYETNGALTVPPTPVSMCDLVMGCPLHDTEKDATLHSALPAPVLCCRRSPSSLFSPELNHFSSG